MNFVIADVTDKGMPAALFMGLTRSLVRSSIDQATTLAEGITRANRLICADTTLSMPVTLFACQLELESGQLTYVNAGHNPPMYYRADKQYFNDLTRTGMFLGFDEEAEYEQRTISMLPGDFVLCYTDGVLDAVNPQGEAFEMERFRKVIREQLDTTASEMMDAIEASVLEFAGENSHIDKA